MKKKETTLLIIKKEDKILLARKKRGFGLGKWNGIGGKIENKETPSEAMIRETEEEIFTTPIEYKKIGIMHFIEYDKEEKIHVNMHLYIATKTKGLPKESEEMLPAWFSIEHLPWEEMFEDVKYWLPYLLQEKEIEGYFEYDKNCKLLKYVIEEQKQLTRK